MASDIDSTSDDEGDLQLSWSGRWTLGHRILAVNALTIAAFVFAIMYLDAFRDRLVNERERQAQEETAILAAAIPALTPAERERLLTEAGEASRARYRL